MALVVSKVEDLLVLLHRRRGAGVVGKIMKTLLGIIFRIYSIYVLVQS